MGCEAIVIAALGSIVAYVVVFGSVAVVTLLSAHRRDPLADELDHVLVDLLGPGAVGTGSGPEQRPGGDRGEVG